VRLLFVTQVLDAEDAVLGFVVRWVQGLARACEAVRVVALEAGDVGALPANVDVRVVGRHGTLRRWLRYRRHLAEAFGRDGFDTLLAHMVPRYSTVAAGAALRAGAGQFLWYTTKGVDARLVRAERVVDKIFTASEESLRIETKKKVVTGHGIDLEHFDPRGQSPVHPPRLLAVGRLTRAKDPLTLLAAVSILVTRGHDIHLDLVGAGMTAEDSGLVRSIEEQVRVGGIADRVELHGAVPYAGVPAFYRRATLFVSTSLTGSVDKVVLEAMAAGRPVLTCNESFAAIFAELDGDAAALTFEKGNAEELAERVAALLARDTGDRHELGERLRAIVARDHEVDALMRRLVAEMGGGG